MGPACLPAWGTQLAGWAGTGGQHLSAPHNTARQASQPVQQANLRLPACLPAAVGNLPIRTGNEVLRGMRWLRKRWPEFTLPIYAHHGAADK